MPPDLETPRAGLLNGLTEAMGRRRPEMLARVRALAEVESPTEDAAGVNAAGAMVEGWATALGGAVVRHRPTMRGAAVTGSGAAATGASAGDTLEIRFGNYAAGERPVLLLGHVDTVWPVGTLGSMPVREEAGRLYGPGVLDMKAGVVMAVTAVAVRSRRERPVTLVLAADEETGSETSRAVTEAAARGSRCVLVLEPAEGLACKTARKGVGHFRVAVEGVAAHAGVDFGRGHSAIREMAYQIEQISGMTDLARGLTVNCGVVGGGTRSNVVAAEAWVEVDVRIAQAADAAGIEGRMRGLRARDAGCRLRVTGGINRPPMERTEAIRALYGHARACAAGLGFVLEEASTGGGSDGNFTAALGVPTLDGLGAVGEGAHAAHEHIVMEHLLPRTALLAALLDTV